MRLKARRDEFRRRKKKLARNMQEKYAWLNLKHEKKLYILRGKRREKKKKRK